VVAVGALAASAPVPVLAAMRTLSTFASSLELLTLARKRISVLEDE
jgi:hypothetical protein